MKRAYWRYLSAHYGRAWFLRDPYLWISPSARLTFAVEYALRNAGWH